MLGKYSRTALITIRWATLLVCLSTGWQSVAVNGQTGESIDELKARVTILLNQTKYAEAVRLLEKIVAAQPDDAEGHYFLASAVTGLIPHTKDEAVKKQLRLRARAEFDVARDRYIEAFISEPYNSFTVAGFTQWAQATRTPLVHPKIDIPTSVRFDEKGNVKINQDSSALLGGKEDGSFAWISYGATRSSWHKEKFKQTFPNEGSYRHSLAEEADALRSVITLATADKATRNLSPSLAKLKKLNDAGLLEAYILLARSDAGIARDHPAYLRANRDKLRRYVSEYVVKGGGN